MIGVAVFLSLLGLSVGQWIDGCGLSKYADAGETKIVGGQDARPNEFPWQVSMTSLAGSHYCGAIVISTQWIMTAAHCTYGDQPNDLRLVLGEHARNQDEGTEQVYSVDLIRQHENYNQNTLDNDISIVRTSSTIMLNVDVAAVCAPEDVTYDGAWAVVSGWGTLRSGGPCCPNILQWVGVPVISNAECTGYYGSGDITGNMVCAGDPFFTDSCQGDSGGPLAVKGANSVFRVIGIVSWGIGCASGYPGVYTRVSPYLAWIGDIN